MPEPKTRAIFGRSWILEKMKCAADSARSNSESGFSFFADFRCGLMLSLGFYREFRLKDQPQSTTKTDSALCECMARGHTAGTASRAPTKLMKGCRLWRR